MLETIVQENHYYPYGLNIKGLEYTDAGPDTNHYALMTGKELVLRNHLEYYDFGARMYDPRIGRWISPDPLVGHRDWMNPYNYVQNNSINRIDPTGELDTEFMDEKGNLIKKIDDGSNAIFKLTGENMSNQYFKFNGYKESKEGRNEVNIQTVINYSQDYALEKFKSVHRGYKKDDNGNYVLDKNGNKIDLGW